MERLGTLGTRSQEARHTDTHASNSCNWCYGDATQEIPLSRIMNLFGRVFQRGQRRLRRHGQ